MPEQARKRCERLKSIPPACMLEMRGLNTAPEMAQFSSA
jgi:hypothetical protein